MEVLFDPHCTRPADLKIEGFQLWIHKRAYPDMFDYDDGNWLNVTAFYSNKNASVTISGTFIMITDIVCFAEKCEELIAGKTDIARIQPLDPEFNIEIKKIDPLGHLEMTVQITPDHILQEHTFRIEIDQSYLPDIIKQCRKIESEYPVRGAPCKKIFNKISISSFCIAAIFFISTILPVIPVAEHLDRIHAGALEWSSEVWWLPK